MTPASTAPARNLLIVSAKLDRGGMEEVVATYVQTLSGKHYKITVACLVGGTVSAELARIPGVVVKEIRTRSRIKRFLAFWRIARQTRPAIVHNHACWYGLLIGLLVGAKRVETVHNIYQWFTPIERLHYGLYCLLAHRIISVSEYVQNFTIAFFPFIRRDRMVTIHNGIRYERFLQDTGHEALRASLGIDRQEVVIGFIGRLAEQKGLTYLLEALPKLSGAPVPVRAIIVGDGELFETLQEQARLLQLSNVVFAGFRRDTHRYYQIFDIFVLPSLWEGLPVSVIEAMAASCAVVATRVSGTPELVVDGVTGLLVEPKDIGQLTGALTRLVADRELRRSMGAAGRQRVIEQFSAEAMVAKTERLYDELLAGH